MLVTRYRISYLYKESNPNASKTNYDSQKNYVYTKLINSTLLNEFFQYMKSNSASESHQNNNLKELISFAHFLSPNVGQLL